MPDTFTIDAIAAAYHLSTRTVIRRLRLLEERGQVQPIDEGGGRGHSKVYSAQAIREHFRRQPKSVVPVVEGMPEPISMAEWCAQWKRYHEHRKNCAPSPPLKKPA